MIPKIKNIKDIEYFAEGARGIVYTGIYKNKKVAIKIKNPESKAIARIENEINFLKILNEKKIGPKFLLEGEFENRKYLVYEFQEGKFMIHWMKEATKEQKIKVLKNLLNQCFVMDKLKINKEEMLRPLKNVIITKNNVPVLIDFERCNYSHNPKNVSQLVEYCIRQKLMSKDVIPLVKEYKKEINKNNFENILEFLK